MTEVSNKTVLEQYDEVWDVGIPADGLVVVRVGSQYGCAAPDGTPVIPVRYDALKLSARHILVQKDGLWGVRTHDHITILPTIYARVVPLGRDIFLCRLPGEGWRFLAHGQEIFTGGDSVWVHKDRSGGKVVLNYLLVKKQGRFALADAAGQMLSEFTLTLSSAEQLVGARLGRPVQFQKWLSGKEGEA
jgi:hypothetical protein